MSPAVCADFVMMFARMNIADGLADGVNDDLLGINSAINTLVWLQPLSFMPFVPWISTQATAAGLFAP